MASEADLKVFIGRHRELLSKERDAEIERSALLLTNCGPKLLEQKGLALGSLGVVGINIGLGGKTCGVIHFLLSHRSLIAVLRKSAD
jgi:DNA polymerase alpha-associated DNA helicase A